MCVNVKVNVNVNLVFITFITHRNVIFDILEPAAFIKYRTHIGFYKKGPESLEGLVKLWMICVVLVLLKNLVEFLRNLCQCMRDQCNSCKRIAWFCSVHWTVSSDN